MQKHSLFESLRAMTTSQSSTLDCLLGFFFFGFLNRVEPGDIILADRGFTVGEDIAIHGGQLEIPAFTKGKKQLSQEEVEMSKQLAHVRIHVERVIGLLKNKYTLLKGPIPVPLLRVNENSTVPSIDKIILVCSALTNLSDSVVPQ